MTTKPEYILTILVSLHDTIDDEDTKARLKSLMDTVIHTAPEIVDSRWKDIYEVCRLRINDLNNASHKKCFSIYNDGYKKYLSLFKNYESI